jgi:hypothetical protein
MPKNGIPVRPKRGPKIRTADNAREGHPGLIRRDSLDSPSDLSTGAQAEYQRLLDVLRAKGTLERVDIGVIAEAARIKALLDTAHGMIDVLMDPKIMKMVGALTTQRRGLLRELGLTLQPSRSVVRGNPAGSERDSMASKWAGKMKVG